MLHPTTIPKPSYIPSVVSFLNQIPGGGIYPELSLECLSIFPIQPSLTFRCKNNPHKFKNFISGIMLNMCLIHWPNEASRSVYCKRHLLNQAAQCAGDFILQHDVLDVTFDTFIQGLYNYFYEPPGVKNSSTLSSQRQLVPTKIATLTTSQKIIHYTRTNMSMQCEQIDRSTNPPRIITTGERITRLEDNV